MSKGPRYVVEDLRESALGLRTVGWVLLTVDLLVLCVFFFISLRVGSRFFPAWVITQGLFGLAFLGAGAQRGERAERLAAARPPVPLQPNEAGEPASKVA